MYTCSFTGKFNLMTVKTRASASVMLLDLVGVVVMFTCCLVYQSCSTPGPWKESPDNTTIPIHYTPGSSLVPNRVFVRGLDYKVRFKLVQ